MSEKNRPNEVKELSTKQIASNNRMNILRKKIEEALKNAHDECVDQDYGEMTVFEVNAVLITNLHSYNRYGLQNETKTPDA